MIEPELPEKSLKTLNDVMEMWRELVAPQRKPRGLETTESHWHAHIQPHLGHLTLARLTVRRVQQFVNRISPGRSGKVVENIVLTLTAMLRHASRWDRNVKPIRIADLIMPEKQKSIARFYEVDEIKTLIAAAKEPLRTILITLALTGMRINEVLALRTQDLDFKRRILCVRYSAYNGTLGTPKTQASVADLHMPAELVDALNGFLTSIHYRQNALDLVFCNQRSRPYSDNKVRAKMLRPLLNELGLYSPGKVFHAIRHTTGSVMLESGASIINVQRQLRHTSATTTLNIYGHVLGDSQRRAVDKLAQVLMT